MTMFELRAENLQGVWITLLRLAWKEFLEEYRGDRLRFQKLLQNQGCEREFASDCKIVVEAVTK